MGFLSIFSRARAAVQTLPSGTMTVDRHASILASTISSGFSDELLQAVAAQIVGFFKSAAAAQVPLGEIRLYFPSLNITARELRGGAVIFFSPKHSYNVSSQQEIV
jgi:hypothetical protein